MTGILLRKGEDTEIEEDPVIMEAEARVMLLQTEESREPPEVGRSE